MADKPKKKVPRTEQKRDVVETVMGNKNTRRMMKKVEGMVQPPASVDEVYPDE